MLGSSRSAPSANREALLTPDSAVAPPPASSTNPPGFVPSDPGERGLARLADTQRIAADTEALGMSVLDQLGTQRSQLQNASERRAEAHEGLSASSRLIGQMHRRAFWMKASLVGIIMLLVVAILVIVYMHWFGGSSPPPPSSFIAASPSSVGAVAAAGRALQSSVAPPPPSPPALSPAVQRGGIGAGLILLVVVVFVSLGGCIVAIPRGIVVRTAAAIFGFLLTLTTFLVLFLMPRELPPSVAPPPDERVRQQPARAATRAISFRPATPTRAVVLPLVKGLITSTRARTCLTRGARLADGARRARQPCVCALCTVRHIRS